MVSHEMQYTNQNERSLRLHYKNFFATKFLKYAVKSFLPVIFTEWFKFPDRHCKEKLVTAKSESATESFTSNETKNMHVLYDV